MEEGWLCLFRKIVDSYIFENEKLLKIWIWCLCKASHCKYNEIVGKQTITLEAGQFVYGRNKASKELKMSPSTVRDYMEILKNNNSIDIKATNKYSVVTIRNWQKYQSLNKIFDNKTDNKMTTKKQQNDTNNNYNNINNNINNNIYNNTEDDSDNKMTTNDKEKFNPNYWMKKSSELFNKKNKEM